MIYTYGDLIKAATSSNSEERKRAYAVFQTWVKMAATLPADKRLSFVERHVLSSIFAEKGFGVKQQQSTNRRRRA